MRQVVATVHAYGVADALCVRLRGRSVDRSPLPNYAPMYVRIYLLVNSHERSFIYPVIGKENIVRCFFECTSIWPKVLSIIESEIQLKDKRQVRTRTLIARKFRSPVQRDWNLIRFRFFLYFSPSETNERWFLRSALVYLPRNVICRRLRFVSPETNSRRRRSRAIGHFVSCLSVTLRENDVNASHGNGTRDTFDRLAVLFDLHERQSLALLTYHAKDVPRL